MPGPREVLSIASARRPTRGCTEGRITGVMTGESGSKGVAICTGHRGPVAGAMTGESGAEGLVIVTGSGRMGKGAIVTAPTVDGNASMSIQQQTEGGPGNQPVTGLSGVTVNGYESV